MTSDLEVHLECIGTFEKDFRSAALLDLVTKYITGNRVLDVGCGGGGTVIHLSQLNYSVLGIDVSQRVVEIAKKNMQQADLSPNMIMHLDLRQVQGSFDTILCLDVLEHAENDFELVGLMAHLLVSGGRLIVVVPAVSWLFDSRDARLGHLRRYDRQSLAERISTSGLEIELLRFWNLLGFLTAAAYRKIARKTMDESFRYSDKPASRWMRSMLYRWMSVCENRLRPPIGLSLMVVGKKR